MSRDLLHDQGWRELLPLGPSRLYAVLFWDRGHAHAPRQFDAVDWPAEYVKTHLCVDQAPEVARWFSIQRLPMLAVITQGSILCAEFDCQPERCVEVARAALENYSYMRSMQV